MRLRLSALFAVLLSLALALTAHAEISFVRVWPGWVDADSFETISEYFTGREHTGGRVILRSQPDARAGFYFLARVANTGTSQSTAKFRLQVIFPDNPEPKTYTFPVELPSRSTVFQLGLTGADWPDRELHPVAWKLELLAADGTPLAAEQSFLWSKSPAPAPAP